MEDVTQIEFNEFKNNVIDTILDAASKQEYNVPPTFFVKSAKGDNEVIFLPPQLMNVKALKGAIGQSLKMAVRARKDKMICFVSEAWCVEMAKQAEDMTTAEMAEQVKGMDLSENPDRIEILMLSFESKNFRVMTQFRIARAEDNRITEFVPFKEIDMSNEVQPVGNFAGFFAEEEEV